MKSPGDAIKVIERKTCALDARLEAKGLIKLATTLPLGISYFTVLSSDKIASASGVPTTFDKTALAALELSRSVFTKQEAKDTKSRNVPETSHLGLLRCVTGLVPLLQILADYLTRLGYIASDISGRRNISLLHYGRLKGGIIAGMDFLAQTTALG